ncbi:chromo domain-containing protein LHP1-like isoform X2 [Prunus dulcis]|uniref:chromo domain-containing protein LHP1-like isoform X2 n=1 Tax=Prunus dulcis TaxID=3755 RepID=UPI001482C3E5|nr:chromo domain-containing protein LHP1-like isoform X2 [Prunus dulcis]
MVRARARVKMMVRLGVMVIVRLMVLLMTMRIESATSLPRATTKSKPFAEKGSARRGWPETDNTWEPLDNLHSIADVIEAFEESLRAGKHRKRKRKSGTPHSQPKKRQQRSTDPIYNVTDVEISMVDKVLSSAALNCPSLVDLPPPQQSVGVAFEGENDGHVNNTETTKKVDAENWCSNASQEIGERREENEYDPKLSELRATISTNIVNSDKLSVHFQEAKASEVNGLSKVDCAEPVQSNRNTGAKRRKSGSVKRFKQETQLSELGATPNATSRVSVRYGGRVNQSGAENLDYAGENSSRRSKIDESKSAVRITKIIKPIGYSTSVSNDVQDVSVTFKAMRSVLNFNLYVYSIFEDNFTYIF